MVATEQQQPPLKEAVRDMVASYLFQRRGIGIIGITLPFVLAIGYAVSEGHSTLLGSISTYYYTDMRNVFVGSMCAIGVFLLCYRYDVLDDILSSIAGALAILVALFPTAPAHATKNALLASQFHAAFAGLLFIMLAVFCLFIFTKTDATEPQTTPRKRTRNGVYRICGVIIIACVVGAGLIALKVIPPSFTDKTNLLFWAESIAVFAFGFAWLVKGETILKD